MKPALDLPGELTRAFKLWTTEKNVSLREVAANLLRLGFAAALTEKRTVRHRVQFPLVECARPAKPGEELTPECTAAILADGELSNLRVANPSAAVPGQENSGQGTDRAGES